MKKLHTWLGAYLGIVGIIILTAAPNTQAIGWLSGWAERMPATVKSPNSMTLTNHQVQVSLPTGFDFAGTKPYGEDIRVTDEDGVTELAFWLQNYNQTAKTGTVWVKMASLAPSSTRTIYIYTKNSGAWSKSNGQATFPYFTDFTTSSWYDVRQMPFDSADLTAASLNKKYYLIGGYNNSATDPLATMYSYDPYTDRYELKAPMPTKRWGQIAGVMGGKIYVFAGSGVGYESVRANEVYDPATNTWTRRADAPAEISRQGLTGCTDGNTMYLQYGSYFYSYSPTTNSYSRLADLPINITSWATCATHNGKVYIINGYKDGTGVPYVQIYNTATNTWSRGADSPFGVYGAVRENPVIGDDIYLMQGQRAIGEFSSAVYKYNIPTNTWSTLSYGPHAADGVAGGVYDGTLLYTFGGRQDTTSPYGLRFATGMYPTADTTSTWKQHSGDYQTGPNGLKRMVPVRGSLNGPWFSQVVSNYQATPPYIVEASTMQTASAGWNSIAVHTNGGIYNNSLIGYHAMYNDMGVSPARTDIYYENGMQFTHYGTAPIYIGKQQLRTYVVPNGIVSLRNGREILRYLAPISGNGTLSLQTAAGNTSGYEQVFIRRYAVYEVTAAAGSMQIQ